VELEALRCLYSRVLNDCSEDDIQRLNDMGIQFDVVQDYVFVNDVCYDYAEGNAGAGSTSHITRLCREWKSFKMSRP